VTRIGDYALLSDCQGAALVGRDGTVAWWCVPRFDSRSVFAALLDEHAGHWAIRPAGGFDTERRYVEGTMALETTFRTSDGVVRPSAGTASAARRRTGCFGVWRASRGPSG
jgi:GH15 family glucan-1,4-alpha-glucosidase